MCLLPRTTSMESGMSLMTLGSVKVSIQILHNQLHVLYYWRAFDSETRTTRSTRFLNTEFAHA